MPHTAFAPLPSLARLAAAALLMLGLTALVQASESSVRTERKGPLVEVRAEAVVRAVLPTVWATLTDYERLPEFIPGLRTSRVIARRGNTVTVQQSGVASLLFLEMPIEVTVESTETPPRLAVRRIAGTVRQLQGSYEVEPLSGGRSVRLRWTGGIEPDMELPPLIGEAIVRLSIREQFEGMVAEIERREVLRLQGLPWGKPPRRTPQPATPAPDNRR